MLITTEHPLTKFSLQRGSKDLITATLSSVVLALDMNCGGWALAFDKQSGSVFGEEDSGLWQPIAGLECVAMRHALKHLGFTSVSSRLMNRSHFLAAGKHRLNSRRLDLSAVRESRGFFRATLGSVVAALDIGLGGLWLAYDEKAGDVVCREGEDYPWRALENHDIINLRATLEGQGFSAVGNRLVIRALYVAAGGVRLNKWEPHP